MTKSKTTAGVTALILCGGRARRLGGVDKGLYALKGRPMVEYVLEAVASQVAGVLISANRNADVYAGYGYPVFGDRTDSYDGPLAGVLAGLEHCATPWLLCVPCDAPGIPADLVARLLAAAERTGAEIVAVDDGDRLQPTFALYRRHLGPALADFLASGQRKIDRFFGEHRFERADFSDCPGSFANINSEQEARDFLAELRG